MKLEKDIISFFGIRIRKKLYASFSSLIYLYINEWVLCVCTTVCFLYRQIYFCFKWRTFLRSLKINFIKLASVFHEQRLTARRQFPLLSLSKTLRRYWFIWVYTQQVLNVFQQLNCTKKIFCSYLSQHVSRFKDVPCC